MLVSACCNCGLAQADSTQACFEIMSACAALVRGIGVVERTDSALAAAPLSTIEIVFEFYQDLHAILMRPGVRASGEPTFGGLGRRRKTRQIRQKET